MICQRKRNSRRTDGRRAGYTFLELALALAIIAIIFLAVIPFAAAGLRERHLRELSDQVSDLVLAQKDAAEETGTRVCLSLTANGIEKPGQSREPEVLFTVPKSCRWWVRQPGAKWQEPDEAEWEFTPLGTVSPLSVRFEEGDAWIERDYDFLTGQVAAERYSF